MSLRFGRGAAVDLNAAKLTSKILLGVNIGGHILMSSFRSCIAPSNAQCHTNASCVSHIDITWAGHPCILTCWSIFSTQHIFCIWGKTICVCISLVSGQPTLTLAASSTRSAEKRRERRDAFWCYTPSVNATTPFNRGLLVHLVGSISFCVTLVLTSLTTSLLHTLLTCCFNTESRVKLITIIITIKINQIVVFLDTRVVPGKKKWKVKAKDKR